MPLIRLERGTRGIGAHGQVHRGLDAATGAFVAVKTVVRCHAGPGSCVPEDAPPACPCSTDRELHALRTLAGCPHVVRLLAWSCACGAGGAQMVGAAEAGSMTTADAPQDGARSREDAARAAHSSLLSGWPPLLTRVPLRLVLEWVDGGDASSMAPPAPHLLRSIAWQLLAALAGMHARGIAHGDVKPANLLLTSAAWGDAAHEEELGEAALEGAAACAGARSPSVADRRAQRVSLRLGDLGLASDLRRAHDLGLVSDLESDLGEESYDAALPSRGRAPSLTPPRPTPSEPPAQASRWYRAPELLLGALTCDARACDVWGAAMTLAAIARGGRPLVEGRSDLDQLAGIHALLGAPAGAHGGGGGASQCVGESRGPSPSPSPSLSQGSRGTTLRCSHGASQRVLRAGARRAGSVLWADNAWPGMHDMPDASKVVLPQQPPGRLEGALPEGTPPAALDLLQCLLRWDPQARPSARSALRHPWFRMEPQWRGGALEAGARRG